MTQNAIIGLVVAVVVIGGGIWLYESDALGTGSMATSTPTTVTTTTQPTPVVNVAGTPGVTTGTLVVASNSTAVLNGKVVPNGAQTTYWYEYGKDSSLGNRTVAQGIGSGFSSISAPAFISGLAGNSTYSFRLVAQNGFGTVVGTTLSFDTNDNPPPVGSAPSTHTDAASSISRTGAVLAGHVTPNKNETSFWFEYGDSNNLGNTTSINSAGAGTSSVNETVSVSGLLPATKYYFRMNAQNQFGTVNGSIVTFTTSGPAAPKAPSADTSAATKVTNTSATLTGSINANGDGTSYWFEYGNDSLLGHLLGTTSHKALVSSGNSDINVSADVTNLIANTSYWYRVVAMNSLGTTNGDIVTFKTKTK